MTQIHKVFVSYHHENDQHYRNAFEDLFSGYYNILISKSVQIGDTFVNQATPQLPLLQSYKFRNHVSNREQANSCAPYTLSLS